MALTSGHQQADTGTKMITSVKTPNRPLSRKGSLPDIAEQLSRLSENHADGNQCAQFTQCDSMLIGANCGAHTFPYVNVAITALSWSTRQRHHVLVRSTVLLPATRDQRRRCHLDDVNGFCKDVFSELPLEFAVEAKNSSPSALSIASDKE